MRSVWASSSPGTGPSDFRCWAVAITKYVSVGSLAAAIGLPIAACAVFPYSSLGLKFCMAMIGITVVWAHRANIKKLMTGKESKLSFTKRVTEPDDK